MLLTTTSVPRAFMPLSQLLLNPREMPTSATTAAMPMEMPSRVRPVRTGRRIRPRIDNGKKGHRSEVARGPAAARSETMRPSFIAMTREALRGDAGDRASPAPGSCAARGGVCRDQFQDAARVFAVEIAGRLVGQQDGGAVGEAAGDGHALAFAAGELGGEMVETMLRARRTSAGSTARSLRSARGSVPSNMGICTFSSAVKVGSR